VVSSSLVDRAVKKALQHKKTFNERKWAESWLPVFDEEEEAFWDSRT
jgi:hypothetical protein